MNIWHTNQLCCTVRMQIVGLLLAYTFLLNNYMTEQIFLFSQQLMACVFSLFHRSVMKLVTTQDLTTITTPIPESSCSHVDTNGARPPMGCGVRKETGLFLLLMCLRTLEDPFHKCLSGWVTAVTTVLCTVYVLYNKQHWLFMFLRCFAFNL